MGHVKFCLMYSTYPVEFWSGSAVLTELHPYIAPSQYQSNKSSCIHSVPPPLPQLDHLSYLAFLYSSLYGLRNTQTYTTTVNKFVDWPQCIIAVHYSR
jgi:hypothetical protein